MANRETSVANAFETSLTAPVTASDVTFNVESVGSLTSPCYLVIDPDNPAKREYVFFDGTFTATTFVTSSTANRGLPGSTSGAQSHSAGAKVRSAPMAQHIDDLNDRVDAHAAATDPHTQYLTSAEGNAAYLGRNGEQGVFDVTHSAYGAVGDGVTDDSAAFAAAYAAAVAAVSADSSGVSSNALGRAVIYVPPGDYKIVTAESLMDTSAVTRAVGITYQGAGPASNIIFAPAAAGYLLNNDDEWLDVTFRDLLFTANGTSPSFMRSNSAGGAQNYYFERVRWNGVWVHGVDLVGSNTNSELTWNKCKITGTWSTGFLYSADTDPPSSDQFLNYTFHSTDFEATSGYFVNLGLGGNVSTFGGSFIFHGGVGGTFFNYRIGDHARGVQRHLSVGGRFEIKDTSVKIIDCAWKSGTVAFVNCDTESQASVVGTSVTARFTASNAGGPSVLWENCSIQGQHEYVYSSNNYEYPRSAVYDGCFFPHYTEIEDVLVHTASSTTNLGSQWPVEFRACRGALVAGNYIYRGDQVAKWSVATGARPLRRTAVFKTPAGSVPIASSLSLWLPTGAVVVGFSAYLPSGVLASTTTGWTVTITTNEASPTTLMSFGGGGYHQLGSGYNVSKELSFPCDTDTKRQLTLTTNADYNATTSQSWVAVHYLV